jgi:hypothetical protein
MSAAINRRWHSMSAIPLSLSSAGHAEMLPFVHLQFLRHVFLSVMIMSLPGVDCSNQALASSERNKTNIGLSEADPASARDALFRPRTSETGASGTSARVGHRTSPCQFADARQVPGWRNRESLMSLNRNWESGQSEHSHWAVTERSTRLERLGRS